VVVGCPQENPCSLSYAIIGAAANDEVVVTSGTYNLSAGIEATVPLEIDGKAGQARPLIVGASGVTPLTSFVKQTIRNLTIEATNSTSGTLFVVGDGSVFDHLELVASGSGALALRPGVNFTLTDSLLRAAGSSAGGLFVQGVADGSSQLRNDTIVASGSESLAVSVYVVMKGKTVTINPTNVIADAAIDASAGATPEASGVINFDHSNLDTMTGSVTSTNGQTAPPQFVNAAAGDFRELATSPTVDAGATDGLIGLTDLTGSPRSLPACIGGTQIPDIGAYELVPVVACPSKPSNHIGFGKLKRNKKKGIARLALKLPGPGTVSLGGKGVVTQPAASRTSILIKAKGKWKRKLDRTGSVKLKLEVTFSPAGGEPAAQARTVKLVKRLGQS
jgi:hypothetical protein